MHTDRVSLLEIFKKGNFMRGFNLKRVLSMVCVICMLTGNAVIAEDVQWNNYSFDGFENTIENAHRIKSAVSMRMIHLGNSIEKTVGKTEKDNITPYEGYSCINNYSADKTWGFAFHNLMPEFTKADLGKKVKVSLRFYIEQIRSVGVASDRDILIGISDESEENIIGENLKPSTDEWMECAYEYTLTEDNINCNKIILKGVSWNFPHWYNVDAVSVDVSEALSQSGVIQLNVDGQNIATNAPLKILNGNLMLPAEELFKAVGVEYSFNDDNSVVSAKFGKKTATFTKNSTTVDVDNRKIYECGTTCTQIIDNKLYIPYKAFKVAYDADIKWDALNSTVEINTEMPVIRRNVPKSSLTSTSDMKDIYFDEPVGAEILDWDNLPEEKYVTVMDENYMLANTPKIPYGNKGTVEKITVEGQDFTEAFSISLQTKPANTYDIQFALGDLETACTNAGITLEAGDVMLMEFSFRSVDADNEASVRPFVQAPLVNWYPKCLNETVTAGSEWTKVHLPFMMEAHNSVLTKNVYIALGMKVQNLQIGGFRVLNFKNNVTMEQFDYETDIKRAMREVYDKNAQWRKDAIYRIEQIRKDDINITVVDNFGNPVEDADVDVSMFEHEFKWGTCVHNHIAGGITEKPDTNTQIDTVAKYFNYIVCDTASKWSGYRSGRFVTRQLLDAFEKKGVDGRFHCAIWDGNGLPVDVAAVVDDKAVLDEKIYTHFDAIFSDYGDIDDWDIMNEAVYNKTISDKYGEEVYKEWFDYAKAKLPQNSILQYNEAYHNDAWTGIIDRMIENGVPCNSYGIQSHYTLSVIEDKMAIFTDLEDRGLKGMVSEFDLVEADEKLQAGNVRDYLIAAFASPAIESFLMWGYEDSYHHKKNSPLLYSDKTLKPAGEQFVDLVYNKWWTQENGTTDKNGKCSVRGYYGALELNRMAKEEMERIGLPLVNYFTK